MPSSHALARLISPCLLVTVAGLRLPPGGRAPAPRMLETAGQWRGAWDKYASDEEPAEERGPNSEEELRITVGPAGAKGDGAFAAEPAAPGRWICRYHGPLLSLLETQLAYDENDPSYLFMINPDLYIDGNSSGHFSRYFNHDQRGNLNFTVDEPNARVDFFAAAPLQVGDELTFDYGVTWLVAQ